MLKKLSVILFLAIFVLGMTASARDLDLKAGLINDEAGREAKLFADDREQTQVMSPVKPYGVQSIAQTFAPTRQFYTNEITIRDMWHNTAPGRNIFYGGYYNAGCDFVYMNFPDRYFIGATQVSQVRGAIFDWGAGIWDFTVGGGLQPFGINPSYYPNQNADPKTGQGVIGFHSFPGAGTSGWSHAGLAGPCPGDMYTYVSDSMPGPPNTANIQTGFCGDTDANQNNGPYIWPHIDVDTNSAGQVVIHAAANETVCQAAPADPIETSSLVYYRKVGSDPWEGPIFMDSAYLISQLVVADKTTDDVYYCYLKPLGYYYGTQDPCHANGVGHYQLGSEVVYRKSTNGGDTWGSITYVTDYLSGFANERTDPAIYDLSAMVDPSGNLHLVWFSVNRGTPDDPDDTQCTLYYTGKLWHYDSGNDCISIAYDASHPALFAGTFPTFFWTVAKYNVSWCDDKLYISFIRYGANPVGDTSFEVGAGSPGQAELYMVSDILVVGSDAPTGSMGKTWTEAINLTQTPSDSCLPGDCFSETWVTMAPYSTDSLMISYLEDKDPGLWFNRDEGVQTDNPLMFMTWPCFTMADVGSTPCVSVVPTDPTYDEVALAPNGNTAPPCNTPASYSGELLLNNCGNVGLNYTATSNDAWLSVDAGGAGPIDAGVGPRYSDDPSWSGAPGCATPATISWTASSATLGEGNYTGTITVDIDDVGVDDFDITVNLVVTCEYYVPEFAKITGGCWIVDLWNTPQAAHQQVDPTGNMLFYACGGDSITPLYHEAFAVGWQDGGEIKMYSDAITQDSSELHMRALSAISQSEFGTPGSGIGYYKTEGFWSTPDSNVQGKIEYFVPGHQDTSVLIEKVTLWNTSGGALSDFIVGEESDWDCDPDSSIDAGFIDFGYNMVYMTGDHNGTNIAAGLKPIVGPNASYGAEAVNGYDYAYFSLGWYPDTMYNKLQSIAGGLNVFTDSVNGTEMRILNTFYGGTLAVDDTLEICKVKAVSLTGQSGLQALISKGELYAWKYPTILNAELMASPTTVNFNHNNNKAQPVLVSVWEDNYGLNVPIEFTLDDGGEGWLEAIALPNTTPGIVTVGYDETVANGLADDTYNGTVTIYSPEIGEDEIVVNVTLTVTTLPCQGKCGDANNDGSVNVSDAVYIINFVFVGGGAPQPVQACGDANSDASVNVSDAVYIINFVFVGGGAPTDCSPGSWTAGDCCPFTP